MNQYLQQVKAHWNQVSDSEWYRSLRTEEQLTLLVNQPETAFHPQVFKLLQKYLGDFSHRKVLVPSSGDNHAVLAMALLGADVTSADISERQLENAYLLSSKLGLSIRFVCEDTMQLSSIESQAYDLVYTSNGTHSWIADLNSMYTQIWRVLKPSGFSVMYDVHPFHRPFTGEVWKEPKICKSYFEGQAELHWRVQDLINAMIHSGFSIREMAELQAVDASFWFQYDELIQADQSQIEKVNDWHHNPMAALPAWLSIVAQKKIL